MIFSFLTNNKNIIISFSTIEGCGVKPNDSGRCLKKVMQSFRKVDDEVVKIIESERL